MHIVEHKYSNKTRNLCVVLADGWSGLSSDRVGDYTETWAAVPGAAKGFCRSTTRICMIFLCVWVFLMYADNNVKTWLFQAVLAVIVFVNLKGMFKQHSDIVTLWKRSKIDLVSSLIITLV